MDNDKTIDFKNSKEYGVIFKTIKFITKFNLFLSKEKNNNKFYKIIKILISKWPGIEITKKNTIILIIFFLKEKEIIKFRIINNTKVCICTPVKDENRYIKEYVEHYEKYGVDKIFLYDNNNVDGERLENVIGEYIKKGLVEIFDYRGTKTPIFQIMNDCYQRNYKAYDWLIFFEVDEYIHLSNYTNVKSYLQRDVFKNCEIIHLNWVIHTDNNLIYYDNRPLHIRFPEVEPNAKKNINKRRNLVKSIIRGHIPNVRINSVHKLNKKLKRCDGFGKPEISKGIHTSDFRFYYIDHYYSKSLEEFVEKINKGDVLQGQRLSFKYVRVASYFYKNKITLEKLNYIENHTNLNLTQYKIRLKKKK